MVGCLAMRLLIALGVARDILEVRAFLRVAARTLGGEGSSRCQLFRTLLPGDTD